MTFGGLKQIKEKSFEESNQSFSDQSSPLDVSSCSEDFMMLNITTSNQDSNKTRNQGLVDINIYEQLSVGNDEITI